MTPAEWLEAEYDRQAADPMRKPTNHERPMFELLTDVRLWGAARWPDPFAGSDLDEIDRYRAEHAERVAELNGAAA